MTKDEYRELLKDGRWQRKRLEIMQRDDFKCRECGMTNDLNVHHIRYIDGRMPQVVMPTDKQGEGEGKTQTEVKEDDFDPKKVKRIDRFEYDGDNFHVVIEGGKLTFTDKETGKVIERK